MRHAILISTLVVIAAAACYGMSDDDLKTFTTNLSDALLDIGLTLDDSRIRHDYATPDSFRLPLVDSLMYEPTTLLYRVDGIAARIESDTSLTDMVADLWRAMSVEILMPATPKEGTRIRDVRGNLAHLPPEVSQPIALYLDRIETAALVRSLALEPVAQDLDFLRDNAPFLVTPRQGYEDVSPFQLDNRAGEDTYTSGAFSQGAGFLGVGLLSEGGGNDCYLAEAQSQAFGSMMGGGLLIERGGNDTYLTNMSQTDILRYDDHYLSLSQGCAFGYRPDYSGGIGLLIDSSGNDLYSSDIFGQGVGYWYCVGALIDRAGHDLALGLLADFSGNGCYTAVDLSQGAGSANGTGILYDADGVDAYSSKNKVNVSGYGDYRREFGSIGLAIDAKGDDFYSARGENESLWESGKYGLGIDIPGEATKRHATKDILVKIGAPAVPMLCDETTSSA
jgi:hypothetical protein